MSVALGCCTIGWPRVGGNNFGICRVRGGIYHELEVVFNALVLCLKETKNLDVLLDFPRTKS